MNILSRKSLIGAFALAASLSAPLAFAQSAEASAQATPPAEAAVQAETSAQGATAATASTAAPAKKSWSDVDVDKDGKLTKAEAGIVPALGQVFDQADGNADGTLTTDEYKAYVAKVQGGAKADNGG